MQYDDYPPRSPVPLAAQLIQVKRLVRTTGKPKISGETGAYGWVQPRESVPFTPVVYDEKLSLHDQPGALGTNRILPKLKGLMGINVYAGPSTPLDNGLQ